MDGIIFHMTELSIWAPILPVIPLRGSRVGIWLPETSNMQAVPAESQKSFHISSLDRRTVLPQLCRIVLPIGCVHLLGVYDKNMPKQSCILVLETTYPCPRHLTAVIWPKSRTRHGSLLPFRTTAGQTGIPKITYANASKAKHARLADTVLERLCALPVPTRQTG